MSTWIDALRTDLKHEFSDHLPTAALATVSLAGGAPVAAVRMVVVRHIDDDGTAFIASDARSDKNAEIRQAPKVTLLFWCAGVKRQYRVAGHMAVSTDARTRVWNEMSDRARALFAWPPPKTPVTDGPAPLEDGAERLIPSTLEVLRLSPVYVDTLDLNPHPHARVLWRQIDGRWAPQAVNP